MGELRPGFMSTMRMTEPPFSVTPATRVSPARSSLLSAGTLAVVQISAISASPVGMAHGLS